MIRRTLWLMAAALAAGWWLLGVPLRSAAPEPRHPHQQAICAVCGMKVSPHPGWVSQIIWDDGSVAFFDGPKDMFRYLLERERFAPDRQGLGVAATYVTGYYAGQTIPGAEAFYAIGSDVAGPMGAELVPLRSAEEADEFRKDHAAEAILRFTDVTAEIISKLD